MAQDSISGAEARIYGHKTARRLARKLGAVSLSEMSNEFAYQGKLITIRCAHADTSDVGVTIKMLKRVDSVVGAFETSPDKYDLFEMSPALFKRYVRDSKKEGKVGLVRRKKFQEFGRKIKIVDLS